MTDAAKLALAAGLSIVMLALLSKRGQELVSQAESSATDIGGQFVEAISNFSQAAVDFLRDREKFSATPYRDAGGWSIGYGHFMGSSPSIGLVDEAQASDLLASDMAAARDVINANVTVPLNQNQYDALTSLVYNVGPRAFHNADGSETHLLMNLNGENYNGAADHMLAFNHSQGKVVPELTARRAAERALFLA